MHQLIIAQLLALQTIKRTTLDLQFHPEVTHTKQGIQILERFVTAICKCEKNWTTENIIDDLLEKIKNQVGEKKFS